MDQFSSAKHRPASDRALYLRGLAKAEALREAARRRTSGRKVWRIELPAFSVPPSDKPGGWYSAEPPNSDIYDQARLLLAAAPHEWPNGAAPEDIIETFCSRRGLPQGTLSMYGIIGECCALKTCKHGRRTLILTEDLRNWLSGLPTGGKAGAP